MAEYSFALGVFMTILEQVPFLKRMLEMVYTITLVILISGIVGLVLAFPETCLENFF